MYLFNILCNILEISDRLDTRSFNSL